MYIDTLTTSTLTISEDTIILDTGILPEVTITVLPWVKLQYLIVPEKSGNHTRVFHIQSGATFIGAGVYYHTDMVQKMSVIIDGKNVHADMKLLTLLKDNTKVSIDGIGRVEKWSERIYLRVDQTNILLGENISVRGRPVLEIETDSIEWGHSNRTHRISGEALFYLQSHGIDASTAEGMLLSAEVERHVGVIGEKWQSIIESIQDELIA
jgi:SUF system FeS cluster assembly, SufBD